MWYAITMQTPDHTCACRVCCHSLKLDYISDIASAIIRFSGNEVSTCACCCRWDSVCGGVCMSVYTGDCLGTSGGRGYMTV